MKMSLCIILIVCTSMYAVNPVDLLGDTLLVDQPQEYNPVMTTSLSLFPGGGQFATKHVSKGLFFLATNAGFWTAAGITYHTRDEFRGVTYSDTLSILDDSISLFEDVRDQVLADTTLDSIGKYDSLVGLGGSLFALESKYGLIEVDQMEKVTQNQNLFIWAGSMYLWNLIDGFGVSNSFKGSSNPSPRRAALLSAIPFAGAGQWYNGSPFKAGLVTSSQIGFFLSGLNFARLQSDIQDYGTSIEKRANVFVDSGATLFAPSLNKDAWEERYKDAGDNKARFIWYGVVFYLYGIVDAYVDAHHYGFNRKFDITAGYIPDKKGVAVAFTVNF